MSWTDADTVMTHLQAFSVDALTVRQIEVVLEGTDSVQLPHNTLDPATVQVATCAEGEPTGPASVALSGESWYPTGLGAVRSGSVVVAADGLAVQRLVLGVDYAVREEEGTIRRLPGGSIGDGETVQVWALPLTLLNDEVDYDLEAATGRIARVATGSLPDPARVLVSYATAAAGASSALVALAISEAEAKIAERLREEYSTASTEDGLVIGATELTVAQLCDDLALRALTGVGDASADDRARRYMELARRYEERASRTLSPYLRSPLPAASAPQANAARPTGW
jgi:hypothetical protein